MIVLTVVSFNGAPADDLSASFDELGGSIGRADGNQLVLPDPERSISRQHARVVFRSGQYAIVDNGSNPIAVNHNAVPIGREQTLWPGDLVQIGAYVLKVSQGAASKAAANPFADLFGEGDQGLAAPATPAPGSRPVDPWATPVPWNAGTAAATPMAPRPPPPPPSAPPATAGLIPDDWDFLAPVAAPSLGSALAPSPAPAGGSLGAALPVAAPGMDSLDDLFGLGPGQTGGDPLGAPQARALLLQPSMAGHADPLLALGGTAAPAPLSSLPDHVSELNTPMPLPLPASPATAPPLPPRGAVFSWDNPPRDGRVVTLPGMPSPNGDAGVGAVLPTHPIQPLPPAQSAQPDPQTLIRPIAPTPAPHTAPHTAPNTAPNTAQPMAPAAADAALLAALLQGLATPGLRIDQLTPELMLRLGQLLRESTRGAVELLAARAALKREMRAMMTMIQGRENNPLKFSPTADAALLHLMGPAVAGFMPPAPAMRDAFDDLRAHQLGVMAGMKAALDGVLKRFDPQQLEAKLGNRAGLSGLIPATRKARLWELFQQLFGQLSAEAEEDFDELFGKAFLRAYQDQLDRLQADSPPAR